VALEVEKLEAVDRADLLELVVAKPDPTALEALQVVERRRLVDPCPLVP
jgi:hypothetical protein